MYPQDAERGGSLHQLQMQQFQQKVQTGRGQSGLGGQQQFGGRSKGVEEDVEQRKSTLRVGPKRPLSGPGSPNAPILKYLRYTKVSSLALLKGKNLTYT